MQNEHISQNDTTKNANSELTIHEKKLARLKKLKEEDSKRQAQIQKLENGLKELDKNIIEARKYASGAWMIEQIEKGNQNIIIALRGYIKDDKKHFFPEVFTDDEIKNAKARTAQRRAESKMKREKAN